MIFKDVFSETLKAKSAELKTKGKENKVCSIFIKEQYSLSFSVKLETFIKIGV